MLTGTTIDDLTKLVQRAEAHADHDDEARNLPPWVIRIPVTPRPSVARQAEQAFAMAVGRA